MRWPTQAELKKWSKKAGLAIGKLALIIGLFPADQALRICGFRGFFNGKNISYNPFVILSRTRSH